MKNLNLYAQTDWSGAGQTLRVLVYQPWETPPQRSVTRIRELLDEQVHYGGTRGGSHEKSMP